MSERWFTHASPTLFNAGTCRPQLSSCFLVCMKEDSIEVSPQDSHGKEWDKHTISILPSRLEGGLKTYDPGSLEENRVYPRQWPYIYTLLQKHSKNKSLPENCPYTWPLPPPPPFFFSQNSLENCTIPGSQLYHLQYQIISVLFVLQVTSSVTWWRPKVGSY